MFEHLRVFHRHVVSSARIPLFIAQSAWLRSAATHAFIRAHEGAQRLKPVDRYHTDPQGHEAARLIAVLRLARLCRASPSPASVARAAPLGRSDGRPVQPWTEQRFRVGPPLDRDRPVRAPTSEPLARHWRVAAAGVSDLGGNARVADTTGTSGATDGDSDEQRHLIDHFQRRL